MEIFDFFKRLKEMSRPRKYRYFSCDFETTVYDNQQYTEVWAAACVELFTEDVSIFHSIGELYEYFKSLNCNVVAYFHNLKFDGEFWLSYLINELKLKQALNKTGDSDIDLMWQPIQKMHNNTFSYSISDLGMWYTIAIKVNDCIIEIRDSLKLLPFSVSKLGKDFQTKHRKLDMEYKGLRYAGCTITPQEKEYIENDVLVVKEALEVMFKEGHNKLTIGACCLDEFKHITGKKDYEALFPDLTAISINPQFFGEDNADAYIRHSYRGGWCYLVAGKSNTVIKNGLTADVNSLYPSMMSSESGNAYPIGFPSFWKGNRIPEDARKQGRYFFIRIKTRFYIKDGYLPFIQIKGSKFYKGTDCLKSSDIVDKNTGKRCAFYYDFDGTVHDTSVVMTMTCTDYFLFLEHYNTIDFEILDGCYFNSVVGIFDEYIDKYKKIKLENKGAKRGIAKLFLNNLYGKMASNKDSSFKVAYTREDDSIGFMTIPQYEKKAGFIAVGSAITSYARNFTIRAAQMNYYGEDKRGFIYADTDSIHCDLKPNEIRGINIHDKNFCCWKLESYWNKAIFVRQKTYIEHVTHEDGEAVEKPYYNIKCAGMPDRCKDILNKSLKGEKVQECDKYVKEQIDFINTKRELSDFKTGLRVYGKLMPKRIKGGVILVDTYYELR